MRSPDEERLSQLLSAIIDRASRYDFRAARMHADWLAGHLGPADSGTGVEPQPKWRERACRPIVRVERALTGARVTLGTACRGSWEESPCVHQLALALAVLAELSSGNPVPAVEMLVPLAGPPGVSDLLQHVERLVASTRPNPPPDVKEAWMCWLVSLRGGEFYVEPQLRPRLKNGSLGKPREPTSTQWRNLKPYMHSRQDAAAVAWLRAHGGIGVGGYDDDYGYGEDEEDGWDVGDADAQINGSSKQAAALLHLLAGHPYVEFGEEGQVSVLAETPELAIVEDQEQVSIVARLGGRELSTSTAASLDPSGVITYRKEERLLGVGLWAPGTEKLVRGLIEIPVRVPLEHADALAQKLSVIESMIPVSLPASLTGREVPASNRLILLFEPQAAGGATLTASVRPLPSGARFPVGEGPMRVSGLVADERQTAVRVPEVEQASARELFDAVALPAESSPSVRRLARDEDVLDLLVALKDPRWADVIVEWPAERRLEVATGAVRQLRVQIEAKEDWFGVDGDTEIDGETIALASLLAAAREGKRYIALKSGRFAVIEKTFRDRLARLGDMVHQGRRGLQMSSVAAPLAEEALAGFEVVEPLAWRRLIARVQAARTTTPRLPVALDAELREYQLDGYRWLWRLAQMGVGGVLADDMGLGKTVQAIAMLVERSAGGPALVVAPTSVGFNWVRELTRFAPTLRPVNFREGDRDAVVSTAGPGDVVIVSYALLRHAAELLLPLRWHTLIFDEAQAFKNAETQTAKIVRQLQGDWKLALTGTPVENHLGELYSLMNTVCPGLLGGWQHFSDAFAKPIERERSQPHRESLARLLRPFMLRRTKGQVLKELPDRTEIRIDARLSRQERTLYEATRLATIASLASNAEKKDARFVVLAALTRLRQLASHARMVEPAAPRISAKLAVLLEQLQEVLAEGHTALVFSQFTSQLALIQEVLAENDINTLSLDGSTPAKERERRVEAFQRGDAPVFLISLKAGGTGLNLTAADYVFLMDPWWNPAVEDQAADRAHRIGQQRPVTIVRIVASGTVEEKVLSMHERKRALVAGILDGADVAGKLSVDELVDLLRESQAAVQVEDESEEEVVLPKVARR